MERQELKRILQLEKKLYFPQKRDYIRGLLLHEHQYAIWCYQKIMRHEEYAISNHRIILKYLLRRRRNVLGRKLGFFIPPFVFAEGLLIWHYGNIIVNGSCKVGKYCVLHGDNCLGNNGLSGNDCPVLGDHVDIGTGAKIIGNVTVGSNVIVGAGAVVVRSVESDVVVGGVPAGVIRKISEQEE